MIAKQFTMLSIKFPPNLPLNDVHLIRLLLFMYGRIIAYILDPIIMDFGMIQTSVL